MTEQTATIRQIAVPAVTLVSSPRKRPSWMRQLILQLACLGIALTVLFPVVWIAAMAVDPRNLSKPDTLFPPGATLDSFTKVLQQPTLNDVSFARLALNSLFLASFIALLSVALGVLAAYALSRLHFTGRQVFMIADPRGADAPVGGHPGAAVRVDEQGRHRRLQPSCVALGRCTRRDRLPAAVRDLEHQGLPRHDPARARGGGDGRRRRRSSKRSATSSCRWRRPCSR